MDNSSHLPHAGEYLTNLSIPYICIFAISAAVTLVVLLVYLETLTYLLRHLYNWKPRDKALWLIAIYPVFCLTSLTTLLVPRSSILNELVSSLYLSVCVHMFVTMLIGHFGGTAKMMRRLAGHEIKLSSPPICCCCLCLPSPPVTRNSLQLLRIMVLQYALMRPILGYAGAILWSDENFGSRLPWKNPYTYLQFANTISTMVAIWGFLMIFRLSRVPLSRTAVKPKFICLQLVIVISGMQKNIINLFVILTIVPADSPLTAQANGDRWHNIICILEMAILSLVARKYYRKHVSEIPDEDLLSSDSDVDNRHFAGRTSGDNLLTPNRSYDSTSQVDWTPGLASVHEHGESAELSQQHHANEKRHRGTDNDFTFTTKHQYELQHSGVPSETDA